MSHHERITEFLSAWAAAEANGDTATLESQLTDDFTAIGPFGFTLSKRDWLERHATGALQYLTFDLEDIQLRVHDGTAIAIARQTGEGTYQGNPVPGSLRTTLVLVGHASEWRLAVIHMSFIAGTPGSPPILAGREQGDVAVTTTRDSLTDRGAIVTGASRGIGAATARALSNAGAAVALAARDEQALRALADEITTAGGRALAVPIDVTDAGSVCRLVEQTLGAFGRLDAAVNSAGASSTPPTPLADMPVADYDNDQSVTLRGVFLAMKYEIPAMLDGDGGVTLPVDGGLLAGMAPFGAGGPSGPDYGKAVA